MSSKPRGGGKDQAISKALEVSVATMERGRQQFVEEGCEAVFRYQPRQGSSTRRLDGEKEAPLMALPCSEAAAGRARWTLRL
jgi:transposase